MSSQVEAVGNSLCDGTGTRFRESDGHAHTMSTNHSIAASIHMANSSGMQISSRKMIRVEEQPQNKRQWNEKATGSVPFHPNEPNLHFVRPIKKTRLPSPNPNNRNSEGITFSWVNGRLSADECETCAYILKLWMEVMGPLLPTTSSTGLTLMGLEKHDTRGALCYILQGIQGAKLPFLKLREALWSPGIEVQDIHEVEELLLLREMEDLECEHNILT
ncbi:hypothetical protein N7522_001490 [Penicillium canescens]|nr:hypothetical protein N7522_001490 [Penicillium canescens]